MEEKFVSSMVLAGVGDAFGYNNGTWEFTFSGPAIHNEYNNMGGIEKISTKRMKLSDDQVMHLATAKALVANPKDLSDLYTELSKCYVECFNDMTGRAPGPTTASAIHSIERGTKYSEIPYSPAGGGCGGSMRAMCIGLRYYGESNRDKLIAVSIESGRMTHNHPTGFLGAMVSALFTAYALEGLPVVAWGRKMVNDVLHRCYSYMRESGRDWEKYQKDLKYFENHWREYLKLRDILDDSKTEPKFPENYDVKERDKYYNSIAFSGWGGASGHDSVIIAYDALLGAGSDFKELVLRGVLHGGDNDSTGVICCAWYGALYTLKSVPVQLHDNLEYRERAVRYGQALYQIRHNEHT